MRCSVSTNPPPFPGMKAVKSKIPATKILPLEPFEAPENYYCDGEITPAEAEKRWVRNLSNEGLSKSQIEKAKKLML